MAIAGEKPWYRHFWLWFVLAPLIAAVLASFATLIIAGSPPSLVVDDFGPIAMAIEKDHQRDRRAAALGVSARLSFARHPAEGGSRVTATLAGDAPPALRLDLIHPTRGDMDRTTLLTRTGAGYSGSISLPNGRMYVHLTDELSGWRLKGEMAPGQQALELRAPPGS